MKVLAQDYQCLENVELDVDGLAGVVGDNDTGKSALVRSLYALASNQSGEDFIRDGQPEAKVKFEFSDATRMLWAKPRTGSGSYTIDGEKFEKTGRGYFEGLKDCGLWPLEAGPDTLDINFFMQGEPFLIMQRPSTRKFEILSHVFDSEKYTNALSNMKDDKRELRSIVKEKMAVKENLEEQYDEVSQRATAITPYVENNRETIKDIAEKENRRERLLELSEKHEVLTAFMIETSDLDYTKSCLDAVEDKIKDVEGKIKQLPVLRKAITAEEEVKRLEKTEDKLLGGLKSVSDIIDGCEKVITDYSKAQELLDKYNDKVKEVDRIEEKVNNIKQELSETTERLEEVKEELGECPLCGSRLGGK